MSRSKSEKIGNGGKCELSVWTRAITANSEWPDKVNITTIHLIKLSFFYLSSFTSRSLALTGRVS